MRRFSLLALCVVLPAGTIHAQGRDLFPRPAGAARKATTPSPVPMKEERPVVVRPSLPRVAVPKTTIATASTSDVESPNRAKGRGGTRVSDAALNRTMEASTIRNFLTVWQARNAAQAQERGRFQQRLAEGRAELKLIEDDRFLQAISSSEHRDLLAAEGFPRPHDRDWAKQLRVASNRAVPADAERTMREAEVLALRGQAISGETQKLLNKVEGSSGAFLRTDVSTAGGLTVPSLYPVPGALSQPDAGRPYALHNLAVLRTAVEAHQKLVADQQAEMRREWQQWNSRADELYRRYSEIRVILTPETGR